MGVGKGSHPGAATRVGKGKGTGAGGAHACGKEGGEHYTLWAFWDIKPNYTVI
jgi:hypothetical protein